MEVDYDGNDDEVARYAGDGSANADGVEVEEEEVPRNPANAHLKFRNYVPKDKALRRHHLRPAPVDLVAQLEEEFLIELAKVNDDELLQEASKESNWDLKRELNDKVTVMDAATQVALSQLLRLKMTSK